LGLALDTVYSVRDALSRLSENDGPMLEALKRLNGGTIHLPGRVKDCPDRDRLALRFGRFKAVA
jgi:putative restriction endonuclease